MKDIDISIKNGQETLGTLSLDQKKLLEFYNATNFSEKFVVYYGKNTPDGQTQELSDYIIFPSGSNFSAVGDGVFLTKVNYKDNVLNRSLQWSLASSFSIFDTSLRFFIEPYEDN